MVMDLAYFMLFVVGILIEEHFLWIINKVVVVITLYGIVIKGFMAVFIFMNGYDFDHSLA